MSSYLPVSAHDPDDAAADEAAAAEQVGSGSAGGGTASGKERRHSGSVGRGAVAESPACVSSHRRSINATLVLNEPWRDVARTVLSISGVYIFVLAGISGLVRAHFPRHARTGYNSCYSSCAASSCVRSLEMPGASGVPSALAIAPCACSA